MAIYRVNELFQMSYRMRANYELVLAPDIWKYLCKWWKTEFGLIVMRVSFFSSFFSLSVNNFCDRKSRSSRKLFFWNSLLVFRWYGWCIEKVVFSLISFLNNVGKPEENVGYRRSCTFFRLKTIVNTWIILNRSEMYGPGVPHLPASLPPRNELFFRRTTSK